MSSNSLLFLLLASALLQVALGTLSESNLLPPPPLRSDWPCPDQGDVQPCTCKKNSDETLYLDCSGIVDDAELERIFSAYFPFEKFALLTIMAKPEDPRIRITNLGEKTFQNVSFANVRISHTELTYVHQNAFQKSYPILETLAITDSKITFFPFEIVNESPLLHDLRVFKNNIAHMPDMVSDTLTYLQISHNPLLQYGEHAFDFLPNLEYFVASDIDLAHIAKDAYSQQNQLLYLDLSHNSLDILYNESLSFKRRVKEINLSFNDIQSVEHMAISGLSPGTILWMQHNQLTDLPEDVWKPVFDSVRGGSNLFVFDDNPLTCQCNILWLVRDAGHRETITRGTMCTDTETDLLDVDVGFLEANCP